MATRFKVGQLVRQIMPAPIEGTVSSFKFDEVGGEIHVHVAVAAEDGTLHDRSFREDQLEIIGDQGEGT